MRSLYPLHLTALSAVAMALSGCLVSETPILNATNGRATPLAAGDYITCPIDEDADEDDCTRMSVSVSKGLYKMTSADDDETIEMRFRRIGRGAYAVQSDEGGSDFMYYYGAGNSQRFLLTMMLCGDLPDDLRAKLIAGGHLYAEDERFETCEVKTLRGLTDPAKAYYRGEIASEEAIVMEFTPAPPEEPVEE